MEYQNPVLAQDFPDPSSPVLGVDGWYYSFATNADKKNIQVLLPSIYPPQVALPSFGQQVDMHT